MMSPFKFEWMSETLWLSPEKCIFWEQENALIVSDIHFGKSGHFRKEGIGIPATVFKEDLQRLFAQIQFFKPASLIITGDFFHSHANNEVLLFEKWRRDLSNLPIQLVKGNHDILHESWYSLNQINIHEQLIIRHFAFIHEPPTAVKNTDPYYFSGHIHPGVRIDGAAKQSLRFPCYHFAKQVAVLPAFGNFTGLHTIRQKKADRVFAVVNKSIMEVN